MVRRSVLLWDATDRTGRSYESRGNATGNSPKWLRSFDWLDPAMESCRSHPNIRPNTFFY
jgi:hypothetical protein